MCFQDCLAWENDISCKWQFFLQISAFSMKLVCCNNIVRHYNFLNHEAKEHSLTVLYLHPALFACIRFDFTSLPLANEKSKLRFFSFFTKGKNLTLCGYWEERQRKLSWKDWTNNIWADPWSYCMIVKLIIRSECRADFMEWFVNIVYQKLWPLRSESKEFSAQSLSLVPTSD